MDDVSARGHSGNSLDSGQQTNRTLLIAGDDVKLLTSIDLLLRLNYLIVVCGIVVL